MTDSRVEWQPFEAVILHRGVAVHVPSHSAMSRTFFMGYSSGVTLVDR